MKTSKCLFFGVLVGFSFWFYAPFANGQTSSLSPVSESRESQRSLLKNKKFEESSEISDAKIKADAGSLSQYSLKLNLSYFGPTIGDLSAKDQPNPDGTIGTYETSIGGAVGLRYRFNPNSSLSAGTGVKAVHPLHGMERMDVQTPYLSYDSTFKWAGIQMRSSPGISLTTLPNFKDVGQVGTLSYDFSSVYNINESPWAVGLDGGISLFLYNREYRSADRKASRGALQLFPTLKYNLSSKMSLMTSGALTWLSPRFMSNETVLLNKTVTQRLGLGYALTRDIYFFPYLTMMPTRLSADATTMNLSTSISLL